MIHVIATIQLSAGGEAEFLRHFHALVPHVRAEEGCLEYGPASDLATPIAAQSAMRPDTVTVIEKWASIEHLQRHLTAAHMQQYRGQVQHLVQQVELRILQPA
jgi:quinol monooxygenase YgiN